MSEPEIIFRDDVLRLHMLYLEKIDHLSKGERDVFERYLGLLSRPVFLVDKDMKIV